VRLWFGLVRALFTAGVRKLGAGANFSQPFLTDMETATTTATVDGQLITFPGVAGRSIPELQSDTVSIRRPSVAVKSLSA
jgi:hypothetical protein